jgi:hypothetical protein
VEKENSLFHAFSLTFACFPPPSPSHISFHNEKIMSEGEMGTRRKFFMLLRKRRKKIISELKSIILYNHYLKNSCWDQ